MLNINMLKSVGVMEWLVCLYYEVLYQFALNLWVLQAVVLQLQIREELCLCRHLGLLYMGMRFYSSFISRKSHTFFNFRPVCKLEGPSFYLMLGVFSFFWNCSILVFVDNMPDIGLKSCPSCFCSTVRKSHLYSLFVNSYSW